MWIISRIHTEASNATDDQKNQPGCGTAHDWWPGPLQSKVGYSDCCLGNDGNCMWKKPREIFKIDDLEFGYEIASYASMGWQDHPDNMVNMFNNSEGHRVVIVEQGQWDNSNWKGMGPGIGGTWGDVWFTQAEPPKPLSYCQRNSTSDIN